ncbi:MAG TPA: ParB/RepB/Spo0J family partition protein [Bellilinea sp.]|nr:ParB/RepB/Spo0J family partition protein [Bellilinea sp.]
MAQKPGLGRGLGALIPTSTQPQPQEPGVTQVPIEAIRNNQFQPRKDFDSTGLNELAASIKELGLIQPLIVVHDAAQNEYQLIAGERRLRAAKLAGLATVPVIVRGPASDQSKLLLALVENIQRKDLAPLETAEAYQQLADLFNMSQEQIGSKVGKSRTAVTNALRLLNLSEAVKDALRKSLISEGHGRALLGLANSAAQPAVLQTVIAKELSVRETEELVKRFNAVKPQEKQPIPPDPMVKSIESQLQAKLSTRVTLNHRKKGGTIVIHYYSDEELNQIIASLLE